MIAIRLSRRINVVTKQLKSKLEIYNSTHPPTGRLTWEGVTQLDADQPSSVPRSTKYRAIRLFHQAARANEEEFRIIAEMRNTIQHYICKLKVITDAVLDLEQSGEVSSYQCGARSLLLKQKKQCEQELTRLAPFTAYGEFPELSDYVFRDQTDADLEQSQSMPDESRDTSNVLDSYHQDHPLTHNPDSDVDENDLSTVSMSSESEDDLFNCSEQEGEGYDPALSIPQESSLMEQSLESMASQPSSSIRLNQELTSVQDTSAMMWDDKVVPVCSDTTSSSEEEELEVQYWRKERFLREEYIRSTMKPIELNNEQQQVIKKIKLDTVAARKSRSRPSTRGGYLRKSPEELKKIVEASNRITARMRAAESFAKGPHFIRKCKTVHH